MASEASSPLSRSIAIRHVPPERPWTWLAAGWEDLRAHPQIGFVYGGALTIAGWVLALLLLWAQTPWAILPATAGFFLVAPILATGLYEVSRRRETGEPVSLLLCLAGFRRNATQIAFMGVVLLILHLFWVRVAGLIFALMFGINFSPALEELPIAMLRSPMLLPFLIVGTAVGAFFAAIAFAITAVSIPMLLDREVAALDAVMVSIRAVRANPAAMLLWAALIVVFTGIALIPAFLGLALVIPLIAHATWHAYRDLVQHPS